MSANLIINKLYLGNILDAEIAYTNKSVDAIVTVARYENLYFERKDNLEYFKISLRQSNCIDNIPLIISAILTLRYCVIKNFTTLIHCHAGKNRSPSVLIGYVMIELNCSYIDALKYVKIRRNINPKMQIVTESSVHLLRKILSKKT